MIRVWVPGSWAFFTHFKGMLGLGTLTLWQTDHGALAWRRFDRVAPKSQDIVRMGP